MPNYCNYEMHIKGRKEACKEFRKMMVDYNLPKHFWRVFEADIVEESGSEEEYVMHIAGYCAWSVYSCMFEGKHTYAEDFGGTSLQKESERLQLEIEVYSEEPGLQFMEHYYFNNGEELINEEIKWECHYYDEDEYESFDEWLEDVGLDITEDDLDDGGYCCIGGVEWDFSF